MEVVEEAVLAGIEAPDDDEGGCAWTQYPFLVQFYAFKFYGAYPGVAKLEFEARVRGNLDVDGTIAPSVNWMAKTGSSSANSA